MSSVQDVMDRFEIERMQGLWDSPLPAPADGWKFTERVYEVRYLDTTPLAGSAPSPAGAR